MMMKTNQLSGQKESIILFTGLWLVLFTGMMTAGPFLLCGIDLSGGVSRDDPLRIDAFPHSVTFKSNGVTTAAAANEIKIGFVGARRVRPHPRPPDSDRTQRPGRAGHVEAVTYDGLWDGIRLVYERHRGTVVKSTYYIDPHAGKDAVGRICLAYNRPVEINTAGNLIISFPNGRMTENAPIAWQVIHGEKIPVKAGFTLMGGNRVGFSVGSYDPELPLVIDPELSWHSFLGGQGEDGLEALARDGSGNIYVAGESSAAWGAPLNGYAGGSSDAFVAKLSSDGILLWHTFLGGTGDDNAFSLALDPGGTAVYAAGESSVSWGVPQNAHNNGATSDGFVVKLDANGLVLWHTFIGGAVDWTGVCALAADDAGNIYAGGYTDINGWWYVSAFVAKLASDGNLEWHTYLGQDQNSSISDLCVGPNGNIYGAGSSDYDWGSPLHPHSGYYDILAFKLDPAGGLVWHTFWSAPMPDPFVMGYYPYIAYGYGVAADADGNVYVAGDSAGEWGTPVNAHAGGVDIVAMKLDTSGTLLWHTFLGSAGDEMPRTLDLDASGTLYIAGNGNASWPQGPVINSHTAGWDGLVLQLADPPAQSSAGSQSSADPQPSYEEPQPSTDTPLPDPDISQDTDNTGGILSDQTILGGAVVTGGSVAGEIQIREGGLNNVEILAGSLVTGGTLSGDILNNGTLNNVTVAENALVSCGELTGTILNNGTLDNVAVAEDTIVSGGDGVSYKDGTVVVRHELLSKYLLRPDPFVKPPQYAVAQQENPGACLKTISSEILPGLDFFAMVFCRNGAMWEQFFYPAPLDRTELESFLRDSGVSDVVCRKNGAIEMEINKKVYTGLLDYEVTQHFANPSGEMQLLPISDLNADGTPDVKIIYPNGFEQILYMLP